MLGADSATVYLDDEGHVTEAASATIGAELTTYLARLLLRSYRHPSPGPCD